MKKWYAEEYEWEIEVIGFLHGTHRALLQKRRRDWRQIYLHVWLPCQCKWAGDLLQSYVDDVSHHGSCQKWWEFREHRRQQQLLQRPCMPGWQCHLQADGQKTREREFLSGKVF